MKDQTKIIKLLPINVQRHLNQLDRFLESLADQIVNDQGIFGLKDVAHVSNLEAIKGGASKNESEKTNQNDQSVQVP